MLNIPSRIEYDPNRPKQEVCTFSSSAPGLIISHITNAEAPPKTVPCAHRSLVLTTRCLRHTNSPFIRTCRAALMTNFKWRGWQELHNQRHFGGPPMTRYPSTQVSRFCFCLWFWWFRECTTQRREKSVRHNPATTEISSFHALWWPLLGPWWPASIGPLMGNQFLSFSRGYVCTTLLFFSSIQITLYLLEWCASLQGEFKIRFSLTALNYKNKEWASESTASSPKNDIHNHTFLQCHFLFVGISMILQWLCFYIDGFGGMSGAKVTHLFIGWLKQNPIKRWSLKGTVL